MAHVTSPAWGAPAPRVGGDPDDAEPASLRLVLAELLADWDDPRAGRVLLVLLGVDPWAVAA